jgi:hypothetical protein
VVSLVQNAAVTTGNAAATNVVFQHNDITHTFFTSTGPTGHNIDSGYTPAVSVRFFPTNTAAGASQLISSSQRTNPLPDDEVYHLSPLFDTQNNIIPGQFNLTETATGFIITFDNILDSIITAVNAGDVPLNGEFKTFQDIVGATEFLATNTSANAAAPNLTATLLVANQTGDALTKLTEVVTPTTGTVLSVDPVGIPYPSPYTSTLGRNSANQWVPQANQILATSSFETAELGAIHYVGSTQYVPTSSSIKIVSREIIA